MTTLHDPPITTLDLGFVLGFIWGSVCMMITESLYKWWRHKRKDKADEAN